MISFASNGIIYRIAFPDYPVSLFIDHLVLMEGKSEGIEERLFPNNKSEIFLNLGDQLKGQVQSSTDIFHLNRSVISGSRLKYFSFQPGTRLSMAGLRFTLFGLNLLLQIPANHFTDKNFDASDVWGREIEILREKLNDTIDSASKINVMHQWVLEKIPGIFLQDIRKWKWVEQQLLKQEKPVATLLEKTLGYSHKHSLQLIKEKSGLSPKSIQRVSRFDRSLRMINQRNSPDWVDLALDAGYSDQSHFIREFRQFAGYTPANYVIEKPRTYRFYEHI